ncbi:hypothetical protein [Bacillus sp. AK031]
MKKWLIILLLFCITGCSPETKLTKVKGDSFASSEMFKAADELDSRKDAQFYKPVSIQEMLAEMPENMKGKVLPIDHNDLPFPVTKENAILVTATNPNGQEVNEIQFSYLNNNASGMTEEFFIVSVTEAAENPLELYDFSKEETDGMGNELRKERIGDTPFYHIVRTANSALLYTYYGYNEEEGRINLHGTAANEIYGYHEGFIYHIGYQITDHGDEMPARMLELTNQLIFGIKES